jgi:hypothetical protein
MARNPIQGVKIAGSTLTNSWLIIIFVKLQASNTFNSEGINGEGVKLTNYLGISLMRNRQLLQVRHWRRSSQQRKKVQTRPTPDSP